MLNISSVSRVTSFTLHLEAGMKRAYVFIFTSKENMFPLKHPVKRKSCSPLSITKHWTFIKIHFVSNFVAGKRSNIYFGVANYFGF